MMLEPYYQSVDRLADTVMSYMMQELTEEKHRLSLVTDRVSVLDPLATLKRGYSVIRRVSDGSLVKSFRDVEHDDMINVYTSDGSFNARVIKP